MYTIKIMKKEGKQPYYWTLCSANGLTLATSETYEDKPLTVCKSVARDLSQCRIMDETTEPPSMIHAV